MSDRATSIKGDDIPAKHTDMQGMMKNCLETLNTSLIDIEFKEDGSAMVTKDGSVDENERPISNADIRRLNRENKLFKNALKDLMETLTDVGFAAAGKEALRKERTKNLTNAWFYYDNLYPLCFDASGLPVTGKSFMYSPPTYQSRKAVKELSRFRRVNDILFKVANKSAQNGLEVTPFFETFQRFSKWESYVCGILSTTPGYEVVEQLSIDPNQDPYGYIRVLVTHLRDHFSKIMMNYPDIQTAWRQIVWKMFGVSNHIKNLYSKDEVMSLITTDFRDNYLYEKEDIEEYKQVLRFYIARLFVAANGDKETAIRVFNISMTELYSHAQAKFTPIEVDAHHLELDETEYNKFFTYHNQQQTSKIMQRRSNFRRLLPKSLPEQER